MAGAPSPDGRHDDLDAAELEGLHLLVPDDPRSLDADRLAYVEELRAKALGLPPRRRRSDSAAALPTSDRPFRASDLLTSPLRGPLVVLMLCLVVGIATMATLGLGRATGTAPLLWEAPLAANPTASPGEVGGLLPDATVTWVNRDVPLRAARPAVLALVPPDCACGTTIAALQQQVRQFGLPLVLAGRPDQADELRQLAVSDAGGSARIILDPDNALARAYAPVGVTTVLVHVDGIVGAVSRDVGPDVQLQSELGPLARPGAQRTGAR